MPDQEHKKYNMAHGKCVVSCHFLQEGETTLTNFPHVQSFLHVAHALEFTPACLFSSASLDAFQEEAKLSASDTEAGVCCRR